MSDSKSKVSLEEDLCIHIFTVSAAMVGVCLTVIGLIRIVITLQNADTLADNLLACDALLFLTSCILSYWAMRTRGVRRMHRVERVADIVFIAAMILMTVMCMFITYAIAMSNSIKIERAGSDETQKSSEIPKSSETQKSSSSKQLPSASNSIASAGLRLETKLYG
jgi:hypothetical protein